MRAEVAGAVQEWIDACRMGDCPPERAVAVEVAGRRVLIVRQGDQIYAADGACPHKFGPLEEGKLGQGCITCPVHDATFDLATGLAGHGEAWAGRLAVYPARVAGDRIQVILPPLNPS